MDAIFHKASQVRGFLQQNLRSCSSVVKLCSYKMYVDPILDYASAVWSPYLAKHINQLESVQCYGARFIINNFYKTCSVSALLRELQLPRLELRRQYNRAVLMYMVVKGLINVPIHSSLLTPVSEGTLIDSVNYLQEFCVFTIHSSQLQLRFGILFHLQLSIVILLNILNLSCIHICVSIIVNYRCVILYFGLHLIQINNYNIKAKW